MSLLFLGGASQGDRAKGAVTNRNVLGKLVLVQEFNAFWKERDGTIYLPFQTCPQQVFFGASYGGGGEVPVVVLFLTLSSFCECCSKLICLYAWIKLEQM